MTREAERRADPALLLAVVVFAAGVILSFWRLHADNNDGALYTLLARRLAEERTPFTLWFPVREFQPPDRFFEHPPLYLWLQAAALAVAPGFDLRLLGALCGIATVATAFALGCRTVGATASFLGCIVLVLTEPFANSQASARLDPPLALAFTASVAVLVAARGRLRLLFLGGLIAGAGALVKGPPAFAAPLAAVLLIAAVGDGAVLREPRAWAAAAVGTALPPIAFLAYDRLFLDSAWWDHYVLVQVAGSLSGSKGGRVGPLALLEANVWRFWPGLPFAALALTRAAVARVAPLSRARAPAVRLALLGSAAVVYAGFAPSGRGYWWYLLPAYVPLALLAGTGAEDLLRPAWRERFARRARAVVLVAGAALLLLLPQKTLAPLERPCPFGPLPDQARRLARGAAIAVVSPGHDYTTHVVFAEHCACQAVLVARLEHADRAGVAGAIVTSTSPVPERWERVAVHGAWALVARRP
jgi:4-amino-4-deoxy-L-arabinose transferase-like glycosyltransferase